MSPSRTPWWLRPMALAWALLLGLGGLARAQDFIAERAWLQDPGGRMAWADARQQPAQPFAETLNRGYGGALWLRLRIDPRADRAAPVPGDTLVLRIRPAYLDEVQVFDPLAGGRVGVVGDRQHPRLDALQGPDFLLPIARGEAPRDVWLRLSTTSTRQIHVQALLPGELGLRGARQSLAGSLYIGMLLVLTLWGLGAGVLQREPVMLVFAGMQFTGALFALSTLGLLRVLWPAGWSAAALDLAGSVFSVVVVGAGLLFHVYFLREFRPPGWVMGLLYAALALSPLNLALLAAGQVGWALQSNMVSILLTPPLCLVAALTARAWRLAGLAGHKEAAPALSHGVLAAFYVLLTLIFLLSSTTGLGLLPATQWTMYISQLQGLVSSVLLALMLQYRAYVLNQQRQQAVLLLETTRMQVGHERQMRQEQERLLLMLAHEIKTPLATMHLRLDGQAKGAPAIRQAMREMNAVIERCLQTLKADGGQIAPHLLEQDVVKVVRDAVSACSQPERVRLALPASLHLATDAQLLFIVLSNLLENACGYSAPGTPIELRGAAHPEAAAPVLRLELCNLPGQAGWPDGARVFDKYYRAPQAQRQSGTGLGLYLAQSLAQALGGTLAYAPGEGRVCFVLTLPLAARA